MKLGWREEFALGIGVIDGQHRVYVEAVEELYEAITQGQTQEKIGDIFSKIEIYIKDHFATEENYFRQFNYEGTKEHIVAHQEFRQRVAEMKKDFSKDTFTGSTKLVEYLEDWLVVHLDLMDKKYVECFKRNGLT